MVNSYHRFVPAAASFMQLLYHALIGKPKNQQWDRMMISAFKIAKEALTMPPMLTYPHMNVPMVITANPLVVIVGVAHEKLVNGSSQPLAFFSQQLRPDKKKYSTSDHELLSIYLAVGLERCDFTAFTDHKPHTFAFAKVSDPWSVWQQCHLLGYQSTLPASSTLQERATS